MSQAGGGGGAIGLALTAMSAAIADDAERANANFFMISPFPSCRVRDAGLTFADGLDDENTTGNINQYSRTT
jgi:hypothetical protein